MKLTIQIDLDNLPADEANSLLELVNEAGILDGSTDEDSASVRDGFQYTIMIEQHTEQRFLQVYDGAIPQRVMPLISELSLRARTSQR